MGTLEAGHRPSTHLPSISLFDFQIESGNSPKDSAMATGLSVNPAPLMSQTTVYPGPPPPYSYPSAALTSVPPPGHAVSPAPRRSMDIDREPSQPPRQSLPSIHEALGNDNPLPYPGPASSGPPSHPAHHAPPPSLISRPGAEGPTGPPNPFSGTPTTAPFLRDPPYHASQGPLAGEASRSSLASVSTQDSRKQSLPSLSSGKSPTQSSKTVATSLSTSQNPTSYDYNVSPSTMASPNGYAPYSQSFPYSQNGHQMLYDSRSYPGGAWKAGPDATRVDDKRGLPSRPGIPPGQPHSDSVKRQLDGYDVETSLNEIIDASTRTLDFSRHFAARAHQTQRSGSIAGSLPHLQEVEDLIQLSQRNQDALMRIRTAVLEENALAEQRARLFKSENGYDDEVGGMYSDDYKGAGGFAGADAKKRRGKAAPPGRCHSCNRAETPEWRRGPDGARTLCNACGLHYAKLTRKMGSTKASALGSNLKPKSLDSVSPAHR